MIEWLQGSWFPLACVAVAAVAALAVDRGVRGAVEDGDSGRFWSDVALIFSLILGLGFAYSAAAATFAPSLWQDGRHLYFDTVAFSGLKSSSAYLLALLLPFAAWGAVVAALAVAGRPRRGREWLAGSVGAGRSRRWVLLLALPAVFVCWLAFPDLGGGPLAFPAAVWSASALLVVCLAAVAFSSAAEPQPSPEAAAGSPLPAAARDPWPEALERQGLVCGGLAGWSPGPAARPPRSEQTEFLRRMERAVGAAPELVEAVADLIAAAPQVEDRTRLVCAPDDCGQVEAIAACAGILWQRFRLVTLLVCVDQAKTLTRRVNQWLPDSCEAALYSLEGTKSGGKAVLVADAPTLSERLLPELKVSSLAPRTGLVVWYEAHRYTGVLAANLWAISRRLQRLLRGGGRLDLRTLVLARSSSRGDAQLFRFVRRLFPLPSPFPARSEITVPSRFRAQVQLHHLQPRSELPAAPLVASTAPDSRHPALIAALASADAGWPTLLTPPANVTDPELEGVLRHSVRGRTLGKLLEDTPSAASAWVFEPAAGETLGLVHKISQLGRGRGDQGPLHVGMVSGPNPYVRHLIEGLSGDPGEQPFPFDRRLVGARSQPGIIKHHLLLALAEKEETRSGLNDAFLWEEEVIRRTLEEIHGEERLEAREVRFLSGRENRLAIDRLFTSRHEAPRHVRPLDAVGRRLVPVQDPDAPGPGAVFMLVDPERLPIQAYPQRVFVHRGRRYRVKEWHASEGSPPERIFCHAEEKPVATLRIRRSAIENVSPVIRSDSSFGPQGRLIRRMIVELDYWEQVNGALRLIPDGDRFSGGLTSAASGFRTLSTRFRTQGLIVSFSSEPSSLALISLCQALREVIPVHLGVEEDALELVPLDGAFVEREPLFGFALVDLYPSGIGLAEAVGEDDDWIRAILGQSWKWLSACNCRQSCPRCLGTPSALAASSGLRPNRKEALGLLADFVESAWEKTR